jgi:hypothetical protein
MVQEFNTHMASISMDTCERYKERWFDMKLKLSICYRCLQRDKGGQSPFLMSAVNELDPGDVPAYLPELLQVEEIIIARSHVQLIVTRYRGHQYHYTGHCVSFIQNIVKTVDLLPNLPLELSILLLRPSRESTGDTRYTRQFSRDFRVRRLAVTTWLRYLKRCNPDYRYPSYLFFTVFV